MSEFVIVLRIGNKSKLLSGKRRKITSCKHARQFPCSAVAIASIVYHGKLQETNNIHILRRFSLEQIKMTKQ